MEALIWGMVAISNWVALGLGALDWASGGHYGRWVARKSFGTAVVVCLTWPIFLYHLKRSDQ